MQDIIVSEDVSTVSWPHNTYKLPEGLWWWQPTSVQEKHRPKGPRPAYKAQQRRDDRQWPALGPLECDGVQQHTIMTPLLFQIMVSPTHKRHGDFCHNAWNKHRLELQTWSEWREKAVTELTGLFLLPLFSLLHSLTLCFSFEQTRHTKAIQQTMHDKEKSIWIFLK